MKRKNKKKGEGKRGTWICPLLMLRGKGDKEGGGKKKGEKRKRKVNRVGCLW